MHLLELIDIMEKVLIIVPRIKECGNNSKKETFGSTNITVSLIHGNRTWKNINVFDI